jgi:hypothetical protein
MMVLWPKHVVANIRGGVEELLRWRTNSILLYVTWWWSYDRNMLWQTSEEEWRNCCVDGPTVYYCMPLDDGRMTETCCGKHQRRRRGIVALTDQQYTTVCHLMMVLWPKHVVANIRGGEEELLCRRTINCWINSETTTPYEAHNPNNYGRSLMSAFP